MQRARKCLKIGEVLAEWSDYLDLSTSPSTSATYLLEVKPWFTRLGLERPITAIQFADMLAFVNAPEARLPARSRRLAAVRHVFTYAFRRRWVENQDADALFINHRAMRLDQLEPARPCLPFTADDYAATFANTTGFWHWASALAWWAAFRVGDICTMQQASVLPDEIIVWTRKRGKRIAVPLDDPLIGSGQLRGVLAEMRAQAPTDSQFFFPDYEIRYSYGWDGTISHQFSAILSKIGVKAPGKSFHSLRHSAITRWKAAGKTLEDIGRLVAHSNTTTTEGYIHTEK